MKNSFFPFLVFLFLCLFTGSSVFGQQVSETHRVEAELSHARYLGTTPPLREMLKRAATDPRKRALSKKRREREVQNFGGDDLIGAPSVDGLPKGKDPLFKPNALKSNTGFELEPLLNFESMDEVVSQGVYPPDINGEVGLFHVVETVNATWMQVFDKETGEALSDPISTATIWNSLGTSSIGDPIIAYDREAGRWLLVEIGDFLGSSFLLAISEEDDPLGSWTAYEFITPTLPDYPKLAIWSDSYVITTNEGEAAVYVINRDELLATDPAPSMQRFVLPDINMDAGIPVATPADWDGNTPPPVDALPILIRMVDDVWGNYPQDKIEVWTLDVDWDNSGNSQLVGPALVEPSPFDSNPCQFAGLFTCVPGTGDAIEGISGITMFRVQYRNFGSYETLLFNFLADVTGNSDAGVRWMELRRSPGGEWEVFQEGLVGTDDGEHRIMGSMAMDGNGNIALGYSVSGANTHVATRITGRRNSDLPGEMTVNEFEAATGQSPYYENRWGDYTSMVLDPLDDQTFWYFGEFAKEGNLWSTNITSFRLQRDTNDIGPYQVAAPEDAPLLTDQEPVSIRVRNFGLDTQMVFQVGFQFGNEPAVIEDVNYTLAPDSLYEHTFTPTVDMSAIGDYEFTFFTNLDSDEAVFNDTLRRVIRHLPRFDAGIVAAEFTDPACGTEVEASVELKNFGADTLTSVNIYWSLNGGTPQLYAWTGILLFGETVAVPLTFEPLTDGANTVVIYTELPNGMNDEVPANDQFSRDFEAITAGGEVVLELHTDDYPTETTWELLDMSGNVLYSGGPYSQPETSFFHSMCLEPNTCYTYVIYDSYGDGIAFGGVEGYYTITDASGNVLASIINPSFGFTEENDFCTSFGCAVEVEISLTSESAAGEEDGAILIEPTSGAGPFEYSIDGGMSYQSDNLFENLPGGSYDVVVVDANGCGYAATIELPQCQVSLLVQVTDESGPGAMDGVIEIQVSGLGIPAQYSIDGGQTFHPYSVFENLSTGTYQIVVQGPNGCQGTMEAFVDVGTSTSSAFYGYEIGLSPNPTHDFIQLNIRGLQGVQWLRLEILDAQGRVVGHGSLGRYGEVLRGEISLLTLPSGPYFLKFEDKRLPLTQVVKE